MFTTHDDRGNILYGIISTKAEENELYYLFKAKNFLYTIDKDFNVIAERLFSEEAGLDLIYQKDGKLLFFNKDSDYYYFKTPNKEIKIECKLGTFYHEIIDDKLYIYDINNLSSMPVYCYSTDLELIERKIIRDKRFFHDEYIKRYNMLEPLFKDERIDRYIYQENKYYVLTAIYRENRYFIHVLDELLNILFSKEIFLNEVTLGHMEVSKNNVYLACYKAHSSIKYVLYKYDLELNKEETEEIKAYGVSFMRVNNKLCLAIEDPKRYTTGQRSLRKQTLCGNSSLLLLE